LEYFETVKQTYVENWPAGLMNHSISTVHFPLSEDEVNALINMNYMTVEDGRTPTEDDLRIAAKLAERIDGYIAQFPRGAFVRLGSRSPKDSYEAHKKSFRYHSGREAITALCDSERIHDDLHLAKANNYTPHIVVREWIVIKPWQEFRCFYKNRRLVGISQYNYLKREVFPEVVEMAGSIEWAIRIKSGMVANLLPADDVVVDYIYKQRKYGNEIINEAIMLEVNPFIIYTDPCLFNWSKDKFDQLEFRYYGQFPKEILRLVKEENHHKLLVDAKTLEENFRQYVKDYKIELTPKKSREVERYLGLYKIEPSEQIAYELFSVVADQAYKLSGYWYRKTSI